MQSGDPYDQGCFEILGIDVMIDSKFDPVLIEVNHAPSFNVDTKVDQKVKENLIRDTINILAITSENKQKIEKLKSDLLRTMSLTGKRTSLVDGPFKDKCIAKKDKFMLKNLGGFERIYPADTEELNAKYEWYLKEAQDIYNVFTGADIAKFSFQRPKKKTTIFDFKYDFNKRLDLIYGIPLKKKRIPKTPQIQEHGRNKSPNLQYQDRSSKRIATFHKNVNGVKLTSNSRSDLPKLREPSTQHKNMRATTTSKKIWRRKKLK